MGLGRQIGALVLLVASLPPLIDLALTYPGVKVHERGGILLTGASTGIGRHAALELDKAGFLVFATVRKESDAASLREASSTVHPLIMDVTKPAQIDEAVKAVTAKLEAENMPFVALVNNAGVLKNAPVEAQPVEDMKFMYEVNVFGLLTVTQKFLPLLRKTGEGARLVNIGSVGGKICSPMGGLYCSTKHAVEALTDTLRMETGHWLSVSLVQPALVGTEIINKHNAAKGWSVTLSGEMKDLYQPLVEFIDNMDNANIPLASHPAESSAVILQAITDPFPKTRYTCANVGGLPAWFILVFRSAVSDRLWDFVTLHAADKAMEATIVVISVLVVISTFVSRL
jgi:NADP-dependent 3-hydroxy acid dehydrogenase YdfG